MIGRRGLMVAAVVASALATYGDEPARSAGVTSGTPSGSGAAATPSSQAPARLPAAVAAEATAPVGPIANEKAPAPVVIETTPLDPPRKGWFRRKHRFLAPMPEAGTPVILPNGKVRNLAPPAFIEDGYRYEPRARDIRYLPNGINLPTGKDYGTREMLPVIPDRVNGYYRIPREPLY